MVRMMGVPLLVPAMIRPGVAAASAAGAGSAGRARRMMAVTAVAAETAVGLTLVQSAGVGYLIARRVPGRVRVIHRLAVLVVAEQPIGRLRVRVRVLAAHLGVERRRDVGLTLQTIVVAGVLLRRQILVLVVAGLAIARTLLAAPVLAGVTMEGAQHRHALVGVLLEPGGLRGRQGRHEVR